MNSKIGEQEERLKQGQKAMNSDQAGGWSCHTLYPVHSTWLPGYPVFISCIAISGIAKKMKCKTLAIPFFLKRVGIVLEFRNWRSEFKSSLLIPSCAVLGYFLTHTPSFSLFFFYTLWISVFLFFTSILASTRRFPIKIKWANVYFEEKKY